MRRFTPLTLRMTPQVHGCSASARCSGSRDLSVWPKSLAEAVFKPDLGELAPAAGVIGSGTNSFGVLVVTNYFGLMVLASLTRQERYQSLLIHEHQSSCAPVPFSSPPQKVFLSMRESCCPVCGFAMVALLAPL